MTTSPAAAAVVVLLGLVVAACGAATSIPDFNVQGSVYCDTCRAGFVTNVTTPLAGAKVRLECRHFMSASGAVEKVADGVTDAAGNYRIELKNNRGNEEVCAVRLVSSPDPGCNEVEAGRDRAQVALEDAGETTMVRRANALGFLKAHPLPQCGDILRSLGLRHAPAI